MNACRAGPMRRGSLVKGPDFKRWRKLLDLSQKEAAELLGLKRRVVQYYEKGERGDKPVKIPRTVRLACYALTQGVEEYHGPPKLREGEEPEALAENAVKMTRKAKSADKSKPKERKKRKPAAEASAGGGT